MANCESAISGFTFNKIDPGPVSQMEGDHLALPFFLLDWGEYFIISIPA